jgi:hypothetical protein
MDGDCIANFFVIGGAKCGTSSLHFYLDQHPQISMSAVKEPCVFSEPEWLPRHESYEGMFDCTAFRRGEASTSYARWPVEGDAARRISEAVPEAKLVYLVRSPVDRIVSDYVQLVAIGVEERPIDEALRDFSDPHNLYVCASRYGMQIDHYLEYFDPSSLLVVEQSDLRERREEALRAVFDFLDVEPDFWSSQFQAELWTRDDFVRFQGPGWRLRASGLGRAFRRLPVRMRLPISRGARRLVRDVPRPSIDPSLRAELEQFLQPEVDRVRELTGKPLEGWLAHEPAV